MGVKISHSAYTKYLTCAHMYKLHYIDRLRPDVMSSNLVFGSAIDNALLDQYLLHGKDPLKVFQDDFTFEKNKHIYFEPKDYQPEIFSQTQLDALSGHDQQYIYWANFRVKGRLLIESFLKNIAPHITKVYGIQVETKERPGFIDAILELDGYDGKILCDLKTARRPYKPYQADHSTQLALYAADQGIDKVAFLVLVKNITIDKTCSKCGFDGTGRKFKTCNNIVDGSRCHGKWEFEPKPAQWQIIVTDVDKILQDNVKESMAQCERAINDKIFPKNLTSCGAIYGQICPYFNYCHKGDKIGLTKVKSSDKVNKTIKEKK